jgi:hypothetical protein
VHSCASRFGQRQLVVAASCHNLAQPAVERPQVLSRQGPSSAEPERRDQIHTFTILTPARRAASKLEWRRTLSCATCCTVLTGGSGHWSLSGTSLTGALIGLTAAA